MVVVSDYLLGQLLLQTQAITQPALESCFAEMQNLHGMGHPIVLADLVVRRGLLAPEQSQQLSQHVSCLIFDCRNCNSPIQVSTIARANVLACPFCRSGLDLSMVRAEVAASPHHSTQPSPHHSGYPQSGPVPSQFGAHAPTHPTPNSGPFNLQRSGYDSGFSSDPFSSKHASGPAPQGPGNTQIVYSSQRRSNSESNFDTDVMRSQNRNSSRKIVGMSGIIRNVNGRKHVGDYEILDELGRGAMGVVYKVVSPGQSTPSALKLLLAGQMASETQVERFIREAEITSKLQHPNIVPIHEVGTIEGNPFFTMEYIDGKPLSHFVKRRKLGLRKSVVIARDIARALHYAHSQKIVHRDIKPANIMLDKQGSPLVADFGLARELEEGQRLTRTGAVIGTPYYMAPEQLEGSKTVGAPADIYALGVVLYEMLTFRLPFKAKSQIELSKMILGEMPPRPSALEMTIDSKLDAICLMALSKKPDQRYRSAADFAADLDAYLSGDAIIAREPGIAGGSLKFILIGVLVVGLIGLGVSISFLFQSDPPAPVNVADSDPQNPTDGNKKPNKPAEISAETLFKKAQEEITLALTDKDPALYQPQLHKALGLLNKAIAKESGFEAAIIQRGRIYRLLNQEQKAIQDFERFPRNPYALFELARIVHSEIDDGMAKGGAAKTAAEQAEKRVRGYMRSLQELEGQSIYIALADVYMKAFVYKDFDGALNASDAIVDEFNTDFNADSYSLRGYVYLKLERVKRSLECFDSILQRYPNHATALGNRCSIFLMVGKYEEALRDAERLSKVDPEHVSAYAAKAEIYNRRGETQKAFLALQNYLQRQKNDFGALQMAAKIASQLNKPKQAIQYISTAIELRPGSAALYKDKARIYLENGEVDNYVNAYKNGILKLKVGAQRNLLLRELSEYLIRSESLAKLDAFCDELKARDPNDAARFVEVANAYLLQGSPNKAYAKLQEGQQALPDDITIYESLVTFCLKTRDIKRAKETIDTIIKTKPDDPKFLDLAARALNSVGLAAQGIKILRAGLDRNPGNVELKLSLSRQLLAAQQFEELKPLLVPISEQKTSEKVSNEQCAMAHEILARSLAMQGDIRSAESMVRRGIKIAPKYAENRELLLRIFFNSRRIAEVVLESRRLISSGIESPTIHMLYGAALFQQKQYKLAHQFLSFAMRDGCTEPMLFLTKTQTELRLRRQQAALNTITAGYRLYKSHPGIRKLYQEVAQGRR